MVRRTLSSLGILALLGLAACAASANVEQEKAALLAADTAAAASVMSGGTEHFAPTATFHASGAPAATGTAAIGGMIKAMLATPGFNVTWKPARADVSTSGDLGFTTGAYTITTTNGAGKAVTEKGKYVSIWKKQPDGLWKIVEDIGNSDAPPPAASSPHVMSATAEITYGDAPPVLPPGAKLAVVSGDPSKAEPFTLRLQMPAGYRIAPHWDPTDEHVTVLSGTFALGMGEKFDQAGLKDLAAGGYSNLSAAMPHFAVAKTAATVQVHGMGPFVVNYVNPADDPSKK